MLESEKPVYLTVSSAARLLGISRNAAYAAYDRGSLRPCAYADERPLFTEAEVERYRRVSRRHTVGRPHAKSERPLP